MTDYKVTNTAKLPMYIGKTRFNPGETKNLSLSDEQVERARRAFVFEEASGKSEDVEEPVKVQEESKSEEQDDSEDGGDN